jgi:hypothetical protein
MNDLIDNELTKRIVLRAISFFASTEYFILIYKIEDQSSSILLSGIFLIGMFYVLSVRFSQIDLKFIDLSKKESKSIFYLRSVIRGLILVSILKIFVDIPIYLTPILFFAYLGLDQLRHTNNLNYISDLWMAAGMCLVVIYIYSFGINYQMVLVVPFIPLSIASLIHVTKNFKFLKIKRDNINLKSIFNIDPIPLFDSLLFNVPFMFGNFGYAISNELFIIFRNFSASTFLHSYLYLKLLNGNDSKSYFFLLPFLVMAFVNFYFYFKGVDISFYILMPQIALLIFFSLYYFYPIKKINYFFCIVLFISVILVGCWFFFSNDIFIFISIILFFMGATNWKLTFSK